MRTVLIANRGEIALRIQRSCRALGLGVVAVFSDADEGAPWVRAADRAVRLGPAPAAASYRHVARLIEAARATGADAIHPGYGFLAEDAGFAEACVAAGLAWIGPPAAAIRALGDKARCKALAATVGCPVLPTIDPTRLDGVRWPLLIKPAAGGGGRGMRVVLDAAELAAVLPEARREAAAAFGDDTLVIERYVDRGRHLEIQVVADGHGAALHLGERECSLQRRHQKVIEECPSPAVDPALRARMGAAALALVRAAGYAGVGTVEFLLDRDGGFALLEVNTRLQVEHPVTELVWGVDLVAVQLRIARGEALDAVLPAALAPRGHAVEARIYAEEPAAGYRPSTGPILDWRWPEAPGLRLDAGVAAGSTVGPDYDPMLAKAIGFGATRGEALDRLAAGLAGASVLGVATNLAQLGATLAHPAVRAGDLDVHLLDRERDLAAAAPDADAADAAAIAVTVADVDAARAAPRPLPHLRPGFRLGPTWHEARYLGDPGRVVRYRARADGRIELALGERAACVRVAWRDGAELGLEDAHGVIVRVRVARDGDVRWVHDGARIHRLELAPRRPARAAAAAPGRASAPTPGRVVKLAVAVGDAVAIGDPLVVIEAMKMEQTVRAAEAGTVAALHVEPGQAIAAGAALVTIAAG
jgi:acetyl/propionyl-CoA carboxylase alpha subunit